MKVSRILLGSFLVLVLAACGGNGTSDPIDPTDPTTTTDPTDPTTTPDPTITPDPTTTPDPTFPDPTTTTDPTAPSDSTITGTVTAPAGGDLNGTLVAGCPAGQCDDPALISASVDASGAYSLAGVTGTQYVVFALKDVDGSRTLTAGDYIGVYSTDGTNPALITPPATNINITLQVYSGGSDPTDPTTTPDPTTPTEGTISGTVTLSSGSTTASVLVLACASLQDTTCPGIEVAAGSSFPYEITELDTGSYYIVAQSDSNGDGQIGDDDFLGAYPSIDSPTPVAVPSSGINFELISASGLSSNGSALYRSASKPDLTHQIERLFTNPR